METPDRTWNITLEENNLLSSNSLTMAIGKSNTQRPTVKTYKGFIGDNPDNYVRLTIGNDFLDGYLKIDSTLLFIKPVKHILPDYPYNDRFVLFNSSDIINDPSISDCGVLSEAREMGGQINTQSLNIVLSATTSCNIVEIATEADYEFYQLRGSNVTAANNSILSELNQVEGLYQSTFNLRFIVTFQNVWNTSNDPYTSTGSGTSVLNELNNYWQSNFSNVPRDFVYFFSGKTGHSVRGSAASVSVGRMCEVSGGTYAFTAANVNNINIANTTAHEIGHLFNAGHIGATCTTLMCTLTPSNGPDYRLFEFAQSSINTINSWINSNNSCLTDLASVYITGTDPICSTESYAVQGLPSGSTVTTWSSNTSGLSMSYSTATRQNNYNGNATITAFGTLGGTSGCTYTADKTVWVGKPTNIFVIGQAGVCPDTYYTYEATSPSYNSNFTYTWTYPSNWMWPSQYKNKLTIKTPIYNPQYGTVRVTISNTCGSSGPSGITVYPGYGCGYYYSYAPNPVIDELTVSAISTANEDKKVVDPSIKIAFEIKIYDSNKVLVRSEKSKDNEIVVNTAGLKKGTYFLHIIEREKVIKKEQIIVN